MKTALLLLSAFLLAAAPCLALSDAEYRELKESSPGFRDADRQLGGIWKRVMKLAKGQSRKDLLEAQRCWINAERDEWAAEFMEAGLGRAFAYERATIRRIHQLEADEHNLAITPRDLETGRARPYSYHYMERDSDFPGSYKK